MKASDPLRQFAEEAEGAIDRALAVLEEHDYVFTRFPRNLIKEPPVTDEERWEALAFSFYSRLGELSAHALHALNEADEIAAEARAPEEGQ